MGARRGLGRALVGGPPGRVVAQEAVANPHDLAAPAACTGGIVSVRSGTVLQVTFPHVWQMCSATPGM
jgi:hypothetical protein